MNGASRGSLRDTWSASASKQGGKGAIRIRKVGKAPFRGEGVFEMSSSKLGQDNSTRLVFKG